MQIRMADWAPQPLQSGVSKRWFPLDNRCRLFKFEFSEGNMLRWALIFFVVALVAGIMGFFGIAVAAAGIAKIFFFVFLVLFLVSLVSGLMSRA